MRFSPRVPANADSSPDGLFVVHGELVSSEAWSDIDGFAVPVPAPYRADDDWAGLGWDELTDAPTPTLPRRAD